MAGGLQPVFMARLDVKTAFDVAKPSVVSKTLTLTRVHGNLTAALLAEMQMSGDPRVFLRTMRRSSGTRDASAKEVWRLLCYGVALQNMYFGRPKRSGRPKAGGLPFGGQHDNE